MEPDVVETTTKQPKMHNKQHKITTNVVEKTTKTAENANAMKEKIESLSLQGYNEVSYKKFFLDSDIGETTFCLKADYMESSSSHNTCTGNLIYDLYQSLNMKTPPQQFKIDNQGEDGVAEYDLVTNLDLEIERFLINNNIILY